MSTSTHEEDFFSDNEELDQYLSSLPDVSDTRRSGKQPLQQPTPNPSSPIASRNFEQIEYEELQEVFPSLEDELQKGHYEAAEDGLRSPAAEEYDYFAGEDEQSLEDEWTHLGCSGILADNEEFQADSSQAPQQENAFTPAEYIDKDFSGNLEEELHHKTLLGDGKHTDVADENKLQEEEEETPSKRLRVSEGAPSDTLIENEQEPMKTFVRRPFPAEVQPRSLVDGLSTRTLVKTCFRIGEALGVARKAQPTAEPRDVLVELFARVSFSERAGNNQNFQFLDLFHDKPPFLSGVFEYWRRCELWDTDSARFIGRESAGMIARAIGRMKRRERSGGVGTAFYMQILLVREATWREVRLLKDIVDS